MTAPSAKDRPSGLGTTLRSGTTTRSANVPWYFLGEQRALRVERLVAGPARGDDDRVDDDGAAVLERAGAVAAEDHRELVGLGVADTPQRPQVVHVHARRLHVHRHVPRRAPPGRGAHRPRGPSAGRRRSARRRRRRTWLDRTLRARGRPQHLHRRTAGPRRRRAPHRRRLGARAAQPPRRARRAGRRRGHARARRPPGAAAAERGAGAGGRRRPAAAGPGRRTARCSPSTRARPPSPAAGPRSWAPAGAAASRRPATTSTWACARPPRRWTRRRAGWPPTPPRCSTGTAATRFCANCGTPTDVAEAGMVRSCPNCRAQHHPRVDPVVIMVVTDGAERVLLGRQKVWPARRYSALAGFVSPGESLEEAIVREVYEEVGVRVGRPQYRSSQPWPFPGSLMLGFTAPWQEGDIGGRGRGARGRALVRTRRGGRGGGRRLVGDARRRRRQPAAAAAGGDRAAADRGLAGRIACSSWPRRPRVRAGKGR